MRVLVAVFVGCLGIAGTHAAEKHGKGTTPGSTGHHPSTPGGPSEGKDYVNSQSVLFKWIKPGTFDMGSPSTEPDRDDYEVQHKVKLTRGFWLSDHEVTQGEYQAVMGSNPSYFPSYPNEDPNLPVEKVSWINAIQYCRKLTDRERLEHRITKDQEYRLPTEAEWEYAARAETQGARYGELDSIGWYEGNSGSTNSYNKLVRTTHPVKRKTANAFGLYDMMGNVSEWCSDRFGDYQKGTVVDPTGPKLTSTSNRVSRGGSWFNPSSSLRSAFRIGYHADNAVYTQGFRPALSSVDKSKR